MERREEGEEEGVRGPSRASDAVFIVCLSYIRSQVPPGHLGIGRSSVQLGAWAGRWPQHRPQGSPVIFNTMPAPPPHFRSLTSYSKRQLNMPLPMGSCLFRTVTELSTTEETAIQTKDF